MDLTSSFPGMTIPSKNPDDRFSGWCKAPLQFDLALKAYQKKHGSNPSWMPVSWRYRRIVLTDDILKLLYDCYCEVKANFVYRSDPFNLDIWFNAALIAIDKVFGPGWRLAYSGDCEDFDLLCWEALKSAGIYPGCMRFQALNTVPGDPKSGHMVLTLDVIYDGLPKTAVLDNMREGIGFTDSPPYSGYEMKIASQPGSRMWRINRGFQL